MFKLKLNKINLKLYKINISVQYVSETILQSATLALVMSVSQSRCKGTKKNRNMQIFRVKRC